MKKRISLQSLASFMIAVLVTAVFGRQTSAQIVTPINGPTVSMKSTATVVPDLPAIPGVTVSQMLDARTTEGPWIHSGNFHGNYVDHYWSDGTLYVFVNGELLETSDLSSYTDTNISYVGMSPTTGEVMVFNFGISGNTGLTIDNANLDGTDPIHLLINVDTGKVMGTECKCIRTHMSVDVRSCSPRDCEDQKSCKQNENSSYSATCQNKIVRDAGQAPLVVMK